MSERKLDQKGRKNGPKSDRNSRKIRQNLDQKTEKTDKGKFIAYRFKIHIFFTGLIKKFPQGTTPCASGFFRSFRNTGRAPKRPIFKLSVIIDRKVEQM